MKTLSIAFIFALTGCFLTPQGNNNNTQGKKVFQGQFQMNDIQGFITSDPNNKIESFVLSGFYWPAQKTIASLHRTRDISATRDRAGWNCAVEKDPKKPSRVNAETGFLSVGTLEFNSLKMNEAEGHLYSAVIARDYPAGLFPVKASGSDTSDAFTDVVSMPEVIRGARINNKDIEKEGLIMNQGDALKFEWSRPASLDEGNIIFVAASVETDKEYITADCGIWEKELWASQGTTLSMEMPSQYVTQLPASSFVQFLVRREHRVKGRNPAIVDNILLGMRIVATPGVILQ